MTRPALTARESRMLMVIRAFHRLDPPRAPLLREIADAADCAVSTAWHYATRLEKAGYVHRKSARAGWHLTQPP